MFGFESENWIVSTKIVQFKQTVWFSFFNMRFSISAISKSSSTIKIFKPLLFF